VYSRVSRNRKPECLILILWSAVISFLVRGWCGSFLSFHRASCSLWNEATKTWFSAPKIRRDEKGKQQRKKGKKSDEGCSCKVLFSLFGVVKILSFMMIQPPLFSFQCPSSIQSLNLAHFDSVLGPKKILRISPRELGQKSFLRSGIPAFNTRYSNGNILSFWYWNQAIQKAQIHLRVPEYNFDEGFKVR